MCGIVGVIGRDPLPPSLPIEAMRDALTHRGPDDAGTWRRADGRVAFGHRRLAVIDLSPAGHQPMVSASGRTAVTFNGEIYNYRQLRAELEGRGARFRTATDTEVLLEGYEAWGAAVLERLNGMFAFALADLAGDSVLLARDPAGQKPLYLAARDGGLAFASELKALLVDPAAPRAIDREALDFYLAYGYVPGPRCLLRGYRKLPAGHALVVDVATGRERQWAWWSHARAVADQASSAGDAGLIDDFERCLGDAVARQAVADVPVGVLLSGGLDSGLVAALAARRWGRRVRTFTVTFPGHARHDEGPRAREVAAFLGTDHTELPFTGGVLEALPDIARHQDEPIADSAIVPTWLLARLVRAHVTVALGGDGSDELFGGYPHYRWARHAAAARQVVPGPVRGLVAGAAARLPPGVRGRHHLMGLSGDFGASLAHVNLYFDRAWRRRLVPPTVGLPDETGPEAWRAGLGAEYHDPRERAMAADFTSTMSEGYLVRVDRASMSVGLEVRAPFLDPEVLRFARSRVPVDLKVGAAGQKLLPARLAERLLPPRPAGSRKQGFTMPLAAWWADTWGAACLESLTADPELFDRRAVERLAAAQRAGHANAERLFSLWLLALWRRAFRATL